MLWQKSCRWYLLSLHSFMNVSSSPVTLLRETPSSLKFIIPLISFFLRQPTAHFSVLKAQQKISVEGENKLLIYISVFSSLSSSYLGTHSNTHCLSKYQNIKYQKYSILAKCHSGTYPPFIPSSGHTHSTRGLAFRGFGRMAENWWTAVPLCHGAYWSTYVWLTDLWTLWKKKNHTAVLRKGIKWGGKILFYFASFMFCLGELVLSLHFRISKVDVLLWVTSETAFFSSILLYNFCIGQE